MIICNGCRKSGTHQLLRVCDLLGLEFNPVSLHRMRPLGRTVGRLKGRAERLDPGPVLAIGGTTRYCHAHLAYRFQSLPGDHRMIVIQRDPRNIAVSTVREDAKHAATERAGGKLPRSERFAALNIAPDVGRADLLRLLRSRHRGARSFVNFVRRFLGWERTGALVVRFETIDTAETVRAIAEFIGVRCDADALAAKARGEAEWAGKKPHYDSTWTGRNSRWQDWWNDEVESAWRAIGGPRLLEEMGYSLPQRSASRSRLRWIVDTI